MLLLWIYVQDISFDIWTVDVFIKKKIKTGVMY